MQKSVKIALAAVVVVILVGGAGFYWFFLRDDAPARASLQTTSQDSDSGSRTSADGTWTVQTGDGVYVGYRVQELFGGETIKVGPGSIELAEDLTGKGHITRTVGTEDRIAILIPVSDGK